MVIERKQREVDVNVENRKRLEGKIAVIIGNSWGVSGINGGIATALAEKGVRIKGVVGNSRKEQEEATKLAMHIEYSGNGIVDIVGANITSPEDRERMQKAVGEKIDILILDPSVTNETAIDMVLPKMPEGGTVILIAKDNEEEQLLKSRTPEFQEKGISFFVVNPEEGEDSLNISQKVVEILKQ